ncbi:hypothetical protein Afil01_44290 [Actinorhabdospora filicis]|uniref:Uncharacterized protein n=1 Tax=Actinorhabdospora filicis TaxID=1785913 RepID=A0A9W6SPQ9_9ACTN|nr:hypothetical protein [Actinorhabdospora filicis]GLZ79622.1 hypothetical protein Afil01_44290 [Actinorhabdospora filicis]
MPNVDVDPAAIDTIAAMIPARAGEPAAAAMNMLTELTDGLDGWFTTVCPALAGAYVVGVRFAEAQTKQLWEHLHDVEANLKRVSAAWAYTEEQNTFEVI